MQHPSDEHPSARPAGANDDPYVSPFERNCQGSRDPNRYFVAFNLSVAKVEKRFDLLGQDGLDRINAFDLAETARMHMGQINLIEVSSFCGGQGIVWGHDVAKAAVSDREKLFEVGQWDGESIPVFDAAPLRDAARELFGTIDSPRFPFAPGTHTPAAAKCVHLGSPGTLFVASGIGIRDGRGGGPSVLMEFGGVLPAGTDKGGVADASRRAVAESVAEVAKNQRIRCERIYAACEILEVGPGEMGCGLAITPYFSLASAAFPPGGIDELRRMTIGEWSSAAGTR